MEEGNFPEVCQIKEDLFNVPVHIIGHNESYVFFKFTPKKSDPCETGFVRAHNVFNGEGKRLKKFKTNGLAKLEEFLKDFPFGDENKPCHAELLPLEDNKKAENYLTCSGNKLDPTWYAKFVWLGDEPPNAGAPRVSASLKASNSDSDLYYQVINGNPLNLDIEKLSNVPGKYFKRKRWRCRNGLGFVKFIYEGQVAVTRICGRDFFINGQPGSLPYLVSNEEIDITMEVRRLKKPGSWPGLNPISVDNVDDLIATEFVAPAAWTGARPHEEMLGKHLEKAEIDMFRLPKDFVARIQDLSDNADSPDIIMDDDAKENDNDKKSANADKDFFPLPKEAIYHNQAAILVKFVSNFLIQLELISSPTTVTNLVGKKIFASRNRFYTREGLVMKAKETFDNFINVGHEIHCDIAPQALEPDAWVATVAWIGGLDAKPDIEAINWHHQLNRNAQRGKILSLDRHPDHGEIGGLIYNLDSGERAVFVRDDFYLFGTCLAKMDLSYALSLIDKVKLVSEPIDDAKFLNECKEKFGGVEVYRRAKIVWVGETPKYRKEDEDKFKVDKNLNGLWQYLTKRNIDMETFADLLVKGKMPPKSDPASVGPSKAIPTLMAASDLRGQVIELKRPDCGNLKKDTVNGILKISSGQHAGQLAFFPRHSLSLFGHNMHKANLMDVILPKEEFQVELIGGINNKSIPFTVRSAWLGSRPGSLSNSNDNAAALKTWLTRHKMTELEFMTCVKGEAKNRPYFPFHLPHQTFPAKVLALETGQQQPGVQAGLLTILKGPLEKQPVIFEANSLFVHTVHFQRGDLSYVLKEGDKVTVEVTEFSGGKERKRMFAKVKNCLDKMSSLPLPSHYAQLVYVGSRPKPNNCCCEPPPNEFDVEHTPNLKLWLTKRNLTCGFFGSLILGLAPPKPPVIMESRKMSFKEDEPPPLPQPPQPHQGPPNVPKEVVQETMAQTDALIRRVMMCTSPDDPNVGDVICNDDDLHLALFISKSLTKAITIYNSQRPSDISNRSLPPAPPPPMGTQIPNPIGPPSIPMQEHSLINQAEPPTTSNFQNRGLCGLREPLLSYDISRHRRRSGEQFRNDWIEPPFKRKFNQQQVGTSSQNFR